MNASNKTTFSPTLYRVGLRYLLRRPWQSFLMVLGITLGVAVVIAIDLANASASRAFDLSTDTVAGKATHQITGGPQGVAGELYAGLRAANLDADFAPVVTDFVSSPELGDLPLQLLGVDPFAEAPFRSYLGNNQTSSPAGFAAFYTQPGAIFIAESLAQRYGLEACAAPDSSANCTLTLDINGYTRSAFVAGLIQPDSSLNQRALDGLIIADIATAQELLQKTGSLSYIDLIIPEGSNAFEELQTVLPDSVTLQTIEARSGTVQEMTRAFRLNLTALSLLALVVGLFLIYNTMTFSVVKRRPLFGTLRCLGVTRIEVFTLVVSEALVVGALGSVLGILLGVLLGQEAVRMVTQTINDLYFVVTVRGVQVPASSLVKGSLLGVVSTMLTAAFPAWEAASVPPRAALSRSGLESKAQKAVYIAAGAGVVLIAIGGLLLWAPGAGLGISFAGTFALMIGFAALTPLTTSVLMKAIFPVSERLGGVLGRMAPRNVVNTLSRTSIAVAALMVAVSVTIGISLMVSSFRFTVVDWLGQTLQGDIYISSPGVAAVQNSATIDPEVLDALAGMDGIERIDVIRVVDIASPYGPIEVGATNNTNRGNQRQFLASIGTPGDVEAAMKEGAVLVSEPLARRLGIPMEGGTLELQTGDGLRSFPVAGVYYDYGNTAGIALMDLGIYRSLWDDTSVTAAALNLSQGADLDTLTTRVQDTITPIQQLLVQPNKALRDSALAVFDRTFAITSSLQALATLVAFIGVLSALLSLQLEKQRELGILRAIGLTVRQLRRLVLLETGLMGAVAGLLSMPTGFVLSLILIYIINRRAFGWTLQLQLDALPFIEALVVAVLAAVLAGIYPAIKIGNMAAADALRSE